MPDRFLGRQAELKALTDAYRAPGATFVPVYGRRRVGKSELILEFLRKHAGLYFLGKQAPAALQLQEFLAEAARVLDEPLLTNASFDGWKPALEAVVGRWKRSSKLVLVFDEFQWSAAASPELPSILQEMLDRQWRARGNVMLILCGSYMGFMEREVLGEKSPLYGRRTAQIQLQPFGYREAALFHPSYSRVDQARAYFLCGGVPAYLLCFRQDRSIDTNIVEQLLEEHAPLRQEPLLLLREELREVERYAAVLEAIAEGRTASGEVAAFAGVGERALHYYLAGLVGLGYVRKRYPLSEQLPPPRHVRLGIDDPLLRFWFRFVFPNTSYLAQRGAEVVFRDRIRPQLDAHFGQGFEHLCREALPFLYARERVSGAFRVGEYWSKDCQIDVVGLRDDGFIDLGECKWGARQETASAVQELEGKMQHFPNRRNATVALRVFQRATPRREPRRKSGATSVRIHGLDELYR